MIRRPDNWLHLGEDLVRWMDRKGCYWWIIGAMALGILALFLAS